MNRFCRLKLCVLLSVTFCNIEYSMSARAEETNPSPAIVDATPAVSPTPETTESVSAPESVSTPETSPALETSPAPQIDIVAQQLLRGMASTYANLKAFSCVATLGGSSVVPRVRATVAWQRPSQPRSPQLRSARYNIVVMKDGDTTRVVSNGETAYKRTASIPGEYSQGPANANLKTLQAALAFNGGGDLLLSNIDRIVARMTSSDTEISGLQTLGLQAQTQFAGADLVVARVKSAGEDGQFKFFIDRKSRLLRRLELSYLRDGESIRGVESYSSVRINPALPASTFQFVPQKGDKVFYTTQPVFADER